ncbi:MAG TPA: TolC family protein [Anaeromyxobacteraceae bacterium]
MTTFGIVAALLLAQAAPAPAPAAPATQPASTLTLEDALREAQAKNQDLKAARARLDQSRELGWKAWSLYLPQVTAGGTFTHNNLEDVNIQFPAFSTVLQRTGAPGTAGNPSEAANNPITGQALPAPPATDVFLFTQNVEATIQKQDQVGAQLQVTQALIAPQAWYGIGAARLGEQVATQSVENGRRQVLFGTAQAYYGAASLKQVVAIQQRQLAIALEHEKDAKVRYDAGATPKITLLRAQIDRSRAEQDVKRAENGYLGAKIALATLLDRRTADFEVAAPPSPQLPANLDALEQDALRQRPDVQAAETSLRLAERSRNGVYTRYAPSLGAFGRYQWANVTGFTGQQTSWAVGLALNWTLLDGGLRESDLRENQARVREAEAARAGTEARALDEVKRARLDLDSAVANRQKAKEQLDLARENQKLVNVNYKAGAATYLEVSDANTALLSAELTQVSEALSADLAALRVLQAAGAFDPR